MLPPFRVATYQIPININMPTAGGRMARPKAENRSPSGVPVSMAGVAIFSIFFSMTGSTTVSAAGWWFIVSSTGLAAAKSTLIVIALMTFS